MKPNSQSPRTLIFLHLSRSLLWDQPFSNLLQLFLLLLSNLHTIIILLAIQIQIASSISADLITDSLVKITRRLVLQDIFHYEYSNLKTTIAFLAIIICYFLIIFLLLAFSLWNWRHKGRSTKAILRFIVIIGQVQIALGFWLINSFLMQYITEEDLENQTAFQGIACGLIVFNYLITFFFAIFSYDPFLSSNLLSSHTPGPQILDILFKAIVAPPIFLFDQKWLLVLLATTVIVGKYYFLMERFPYYQYKAMRISIIYSTIQGLIAIFSLIVQFIEIKHSVALVNILYVQVLLIPIALKLSLSYLRKQILHSLSMKEEDLRNPKEVLKKLFAILFLFKHTKFSFIDQGKTTLTELKLSGLLSAHIQRLKRYHIENYQDTKPVNENIIGGQMRTLYKKYEEDLLIMLLENSITKFKKNNSQLRILYAYSILEYKMPFQLAIFHLAELGKHRDLYQGISMNLHQKLQESVDSFFFDHTGKVLNLKLYVQQTEIANSFIAKIQYCARIQVKLWKNYIKSIVKIKEIFVKNKQLELQADKIEKTWRKDISPDKYFASSLYKLYASYLSLVRGSPVLAQKIIRKYSLFRQEQMIEMTNQKLFSNDKLTDPNIFTICASIAKEDPARILTVSSNCYDLTGWQTEEVVGLKANVLMASFISKKHTKMIQDHLKVIEDDKVAPNLYTSVPAYVKHKKGYIMLSDLYISVHPYITELPMYLVLVKLKPTKYEQIMLNENGVIEGVSKGIMGLLSLKKLRGDTHISSVCLNSSQVEQIILNRLKQGEESTRTSTDDADEFVGETRTPLLEPDKKVVLYMQAAGGKQVMKFRAEVVLFPFRGDNYFSLRLYKEKLKPDDAFRVFPCTKRIVHNDDSFLEEIPEEGVDINPACNNDDLKPIPKELQMNNYLSSPNQIIHEQDEQISTVTDPSQIKRRRISYDPPFDYQPAGLVNSTEREIMLASSRSDLLRKVNKPKEQPENIDTPNTLPLHQRVFRLDVGDQSSTGGTSKKFPAKLEQAISFIPKSSQISKLYKALILLILLSSIPLLIFQIQIRKTLNSVNESVNVLTKAVDRLAWLSSMYGTSELISLIQSGVVSQQRYADYGFPFYADFVTIIGLFGLVETLGDDNSVIRDYVAKLDSASVPKMFEKNVPIYQMLEGGIGVYRMTSLFDAVNSLVSEGTLLVESDAEFNSSNPHWVYLQNNTINEAILAGEETISIIIQDDKMKFDTSKNYLYVMLGLVLFVGAFVFGFLNVIIQRFMKNKKDFINMFMNFQDNQIEQHIQTLQKFAETLDLNIAFIALNNAQKSSNKDKAKSSKKQNYHKKKADTKGINLKIYMIYLVTICLILILFMANPLLILKVNKGSHNILKKINLATQSNMNYYKTSLLFSSIYAYVSEDASTYIRAKPIAFEWPLIYSEMTKNEHFIINILLDPVKGLGINEDLENLVQGNLCDIIPLDDDILMYDNCETIAGGASTRGLIGLNSYTLQALREVKRQYDFSNKTGEAVTEALEYGGLKDLEGFSHFMQMTYVRIDELIQEQLKDDFNEMKNRIEEIGLSLCLVYLVLGGLVAVKIKRGLEEEMVDWRKILRRVPYEIARENKYFRAYIQKTSENIMMSRK